MKDMKAELIRMGEENPELRGHLRPILDKIASFTKVSSIIQVGETFENEHIRAKRYVDTLRVWDLENAGRRGRRVRVWSFRMNIRPRRFDPLADISVDMVNARSIQEVEAVVAKAKKGEYDVEGESAIEVHEREERGVDVKPSGFQVVEVNTSNLYLKADYDYFLIRDKTDRFKEPTIIPPLRAEKRAVTLFYRWAIENQDLIERMTFQEVLSALSSSNIEYHYYMAVD